MATVLKDGETILFTGDSITDCARRSEEWGPLGKGYVGLFHDFLLVREPTKTINVINTGIGGNTVCDLRNRWFDDVIEWRPDWLSVKIGINDCSRYRQDPEANAVNGPETYAKHFEEVLTVTRRLLPQTRLLLIDPFFCSADLAGELPGTDRSVVHELLPAYIDAVDRLAETYGARRVKTHDLFAEQLKHQPRATYFPVEPVHPNRAGHLLIAEAVYRAMSE